jgi:hypothetical protein
MKIQPVVACSRHCVQQAHVDRMVRFWALRFSSLLKPHAAGCLPSEHRNTQQGGGAAQWPAQNSFQTPSFAVFSQQRVAQSTAWSSRGCFLLFAGVLANRSTSTDAWRIQHLLPSSCLAYIHRPWRKHIDMMLISLLTLAWYMFCPALNSCCTHARTIKLALTRVQSAFVHCFFTRVACTLHVQLRSDNLDEVIAAAEVAFVSV